MDVLHHAFAALWRVTLAGLLLGAGLPTLFALGLRSLGPAAADGTAVPPTAARRAVAALCFGLVAAAALFGIVVIVFGARLFG